jgi:hypothetical protein
MFEIWFEVAWFDCDANLHLNDRCFSNTRSRRGSDISMSTVSPASAFAKEPRQAPDRSVVVRTGSSTNASYMFLSAGINKAGTRNLIVSRIIKADGGLAAD